MEGKNLKEVTNQPYLGVHLNSKMTWDSHINHMTAKAKRSLGFLRRNLTHCHPKVKERAYLSLVRPLVEYCSSIWDPHLAKHVKLVESVQRAAARFVTGNYRLGHHKVSVTKLIDELGWESLQSRRKKAKVTLFYKMFNGHMAIPPSYFPEGKQWTTGRCSHNQQLLQVHANIQAYQHSLFPSTIPLWNNLPEGVNSAADVGSFKQQLRGFNI